MPFTSYPDPATVENLIRSAGYWPADAGKQTLARIQATIAAEAAKDEWEQVTGWAPFLAGETATERVFDGTDHTGFLDFRGGAVAIESVTLSGRVLNQNGGQSGGQNGTSSGGYWAFPRNALAQGEPLTGLEMRGGVFDSGFLASRGRIAVRARWGCRAEMPGDAYQAILQKAALIVLTQVENLQSIASISQDGFSKAYDVVGIVTQKDLAAGGMGGGGIWGSNFKTIAARYRRVIC